MGASLQIFRDENGHMVTGEMPPTNAEVIANRRAYWERGAAKVAIHRCLDRHPKNNPNLPMLESITIYQQKNGAWVLEHDNEYHRFSIAYCPFCGLRMWKVPNSAQEPATVSAWNGKEYMDYSVEEYYIQMKDLVDSGMLEKPTA